MEKYDILFWYIISNDEIGDIRGYVSATTREEAIEKLTADGIIDGVENTLREINDSREIYEHIIDELRKDIEKARENVDGDYTIEEYTGLSAETIDGILDGKINPTLENILQLLNHSSGKTLSVMPRFSEDITDISYDVAFYNKNMFGGTCYDDCLCDDNFIKAVSWKNYGFSEDGYYAKIYAFITISGVNYNLLLLDTSKYQPTEKEIPISLDVLDKLGKTLYMESRVNNQHFSTQKFIEKLITDYYDKNKTVIEKIQQDLREKYPDDNETT